MPEKFTDRANKVMAFAEEEVRRLGHEYVGTEHILLGFCSQAREEGSVEGRIFERLGVNCAQVVSDVEKLARPVQDRTRFSAIPIPKTPRARGVLDCAVEYMEERGDNVIDTHHLFYGLLRQQDGLSGQILINLGLKLEEYYPVIAEIFPSEKEHPLEGESFWKIPREMY